MSGGSLFLARFCERCVAFVGGERIQLLRVRAIKASNKCQRRISDSSCVLVCLSLSLRRVCVCVVCLFVLRATALELELVLVEFVAELSPESASRRVLATEANEDDEETDLLNEELVTDEIEMM